jgi:TatD DNase family protein
VRRLIVTGTSVAASSQAIALCDQHPGTLFATVGIHPHHADELDASSIDNLRELSKSTGVVAVGECGLDYYRDFSPRDRQREAFAAQLELAADARRPVFLHQRAAHRDFLAILAPARERLVGGVAPCFTGGPQELKDCLDLDLYVGVTGWVCDERRGGELREAVSMLPLHRLVLETDAPYLLPRDVDPVPKGRRNEPAVLLHIAERVAILMKEPIEAVAHASTANAERLFGLRT